MFRLTAIFIAVCVVLISASLAAVVYLIFGFSTAESAILGLAALTAMSLYNMVSSRVRDRSEISDQIADLSRGTADLARQVAEQGRRIAALESNVRSVAQRSKPEQDALASEIGDLGLLIKQLAETVAAHETALAASTAIFTPVPHPEPEAPAPVAAMPGAEPAPLAAPGKETGRLSGKSNGEIAALIGGAVETNRIDLYLQPIVTLPQRKVRYYEGVTRLRSDEGELLLPGDFIPAAERAGVMPRIDNVQLFRCVQVLRRLIVKNREVGLFCNVSVKTLQSPDSFAQFLQFLDANRALAPSLILEFAQAALADFGPLENESLAAIADRGFRFSMDTVTDLRLEPRLLSEQGIRFVKVPASLLLNQVAAPSDIHASDLSDLLGRHGISLIAERIETESAVVDLLDYDVRFGQGFLFSPPRPVRAEALQGFADREPALANSSGDRVSESARPESLVASMGMPSLATQPAGVA